MPWVRIDDEFPLHPKVVGVGPLGIAMQISGLCYSNRYLTDGFLPHAIVPTLMDFEELDQAAFNGRGGVCWIACQKLIDAGIWEEVEGGFQIHDYLDYQLSKAQILIEREKTKQRVQQYRNALVTTGVTPLLRAHNAITTDTPTPTPTPKKSTPHPTTPRAPSLKKVGDTFRQQMIERFGATLSPEGVNEAIDDALSHKAVDRWKDTERYIANWLRKEVKRHGNNARQPTITPPPASADFDKYT